MVSFFLGVPRLYVLNQSNSLFATVLVPLMTWPTRQRCNALARLGRRLTKYELNNITTRTYVVFKLVYTVHYLASVQQTHHAIPGCKSKCTLFGWQGWTSGKEWFWRILAHPMKHGSNFESLNINGFSCMHTSCKVKLWVSTWVTCGSTPVHVGLALLRKKLGWFDRIYDPFKSVLFVCVLMPFFIKGEVQSHGAQTPSYVKHWAKLCSNMTAWSHPYLIQVPLLFFLGPCRMGRAQWWRSYITILYNSALQSVLAMAS